MTDQSESINDRVKAIIVAHEPADGRTLWAAVKAGVGINRARLWLDEFHGGAVCTDVRRNSYLGAKGVFNRAAAEMYDQLDSRNERPMDGPAGNPSPAPGRPRRQPIDQTELASRAGAAWAILLNETIIGEGGKSVKLRDATAADLRAMADNRYAAADRTRIEGDRYARMLKTLEAHSCSRYGDLDEDVAIAAYHGRAMAA